ncbi:MAG: prepilin-type N-terminal cleavage/methylation domain-containing protein, partial [Gemmatimonadetes bacterium]|nr:prepilin-type N-terminal cleavage/methylation domain-containing protein [Gemmatimonadota bacterium]
MELVPGRPQTPPPPMRTDAMRLSSNGFTLIEVVIVLTIGVILTRIALTTFGGVQDRLAVRQARSMFASLHARTRAQAI